MPSLTWYARRLRRMSPAEVGWRLEDRVRQSAWSHRRFGIPPMATGWRSSASHSPGPMSAPWLDGLPPQARADVLTAADELLAGRAEILGTVRKDMEDPAWTLDPLSGRTYPPDQCAFRIDYRSPDDPRHVKQVWELSRHHHLTLLACAWRLTGDGRYADVVERHLRSWWTANPVLRGVNWSSGIELGIRLISWAWTRRLLGEWPGAAGLFEDNETARSQIYWHQRYLAAFHSRGSSANNHVIAEAAGQLIAACAFPWFAESGRWRADASTLLASELARNTFGDGLDREQAFEYHGFVAELGMAAASEAAAAGIPFGQDTWSRLCRMVDAAAAVVDRAGHPPRYGDGDGGRALLVTPPAADRWASLLSTGAAIFGPLPWWPPTAPDAQSVALSHLLDGTIEVPARPAGRPSHFAEAGLTVLRSPADDDHEIWCRCDGGPHGFLSIGAHAHADALSLEVRHDGVELLVDPGTYCYQGTPAWRHYFRSTLAHNTVELDECDQSVPGGPFLWSTQARTRLVDVALEPGRPQRWCAEHDGYSRLDPGALHRRAVALDPAARSLRVTDEIIGDGDYRIRMTFHLGPQIEVTLDADRALLRWEGREGERSAATLALPSQLRWSAVRGAVEPLMGWYSPRFGCKVPTTTLVGAGTMGDGPFETELRFAGR